MRLPVALLIVLALIAAPRGTEAASSINTTLPVQGKPYNAAPIRDNFGTAANDINALQSLNAGADAPSAPSLGYLWLDTSATPYVLKTWSPAGNQWVAIAAFNQSSAQWIPPVGGGTIPSITSAATTNLGSTAAAAVNITGSQSIASLGTVPEGQVKFLTFTASPTIVYNSTFMILPGAANIAVTPGQTAVAISLGAGKWRITFNGAISNCGLFTSVANGCVPASGGGTANFLRADGTWAAPSSVSVTASTASINIDPSPGTGAFTVGTFELVNGETGGDYLVDGSDATYTILTGAHTYTLPQAGTGAFTSGWYGCFLNIGTVGNSTISTTTSTFKGAGGTSSLTLAPGAWACVNTNGVDWMTRTGTSASACSGVAATSVLFSDGATCVGDVGNFFYNSTAGLLTVVGKNTFATPQALTVIGGDGAHGALKVYANYDPMLLPSGYVGVDYNLLHSSGVVQSIDAAGNPGHLTINPAGPTVSVGTTLETLVAQPAETAGFIVNTASASTWPFAVGSGGAFIGGIYSNSNRITEFRSYDYYGAGVFRAQISGDPTRTSFVPNRFTAAGLTDNTLNCTGANAALQTNGSGDLTCGAISGGGGITIGGSVNDLLYKSAADTTAGITLTNGQVAIGRTGNSPAAGTMTGSGGITVSTGSGSIDISGAGAAGGNGLFQPVMSTLPTCASSGFTTWVNQGGATCTDDATGATITAPFSGTNNLRVRRTTAPVSTPYSYQFLLGEQGGLANSWGCAFGWDNGTKLNVLDVGFTTGSFLFQTIRWDNVTTPATTTTYITNGGVIPAVWVGIENDGTNYHYAYSTDGAHFVDIETGTLAGSSLAGAFTNVDWYARNSNAANATCTMMSFKANAGALPR